MFDSYIREVVFLETFDSLLPANIETFFYCLILMNLNMYRHGDNGEVSRAPVLFSPVLSQS